MTSSCKGSTRSDSSLLSAWYDRDHSLIRSPMFTFYLVPNFHSEHVDVTMCYVRRNHEPRLAHEMQKLHRRLSIRTLGAGIHPQIFALREQQTAFCLKSLSCSLQAI